MLMEMRKKNGSFWRKIAENWAYEKKFIKFEADWDKETGNLRQKKCRRKMCILIIKVKAAGLASECPS